MLMPVPVVVAVPIHHRKDEVTGICQRRLAVKQLLTSLERMVEECGRWSALITGCGTSKQRKLVRDESSSLRSLQ